MHAISLENAPQSQRGGPLLLRDKETQEALKLLKDAFFDVEKAQNVWEAVLNAPQWHGNPVWIHGDLHAGNVLVNNSGSISAIIDFGLSGVGDPACDLMAAWTLLSPETRKVFRDIINVDDATWLRGHGWALTFGLVALPYYRDTNPILAYIAQNTIDQVLSDVF